MNLAPGYYVASVCSAEAYHADPALEPSLSSSLAKVLVTQTARRAWMQHPRLNPDFVPEVSEKFDLGSAVHDTLSSGGRRVHIVTGYDDWRKKEAQEKRDEARARGFVPLLDHQAEQIALICKSVRDQLEGIELGASEPVFIAKDRGVWLRAMMDCFNPPFIRDFKVTKINLADDTAIGPHIVGHGLDLRAWFYLRVAELVFPEWAGRLKYEWIFVEEDAPHGVRIIECDATFREMGRRKGEHAIGLWERCMRTGHWPHLGGLPKTVPYPGWAEARWLERESIEGFVQGPMATLRKETLVDDD